MLISLFTVAPRKGLGQEWGGFKRVSKRGRQERNSKIALDLGLTEWVLRLDIVGF